MILHKAKADCPRGCRLQNLKVLKAWCALVGCFFCHVNTFWGDFDFPGVHIGGANAFFCHVRSFIGEGRIQEAFWLTSMQERCFWRCAQRASTPMLFVA